MPQKFVTQLELVCCRRRRQRTLVATSCALAAVTLVTLTLMGLDYTLGITDPLGRTIWTILLGGLGVLIGSRWWRVVSETGESPLQLAHEVERRHPELRDLVSSAWDFDRQIGDNPIAGSESLRRAVVNRVATASDDVDWQHLVSRRPLQRAALALAGVAMMLGGLAWCLPQALGTGLKRLVNPLSTAEWPREHDLQFVEPPLQLATGKDLVLRLRDTRGALPSSVTMHYRIGRQGRSREETQTLLTATDPLEIRLVNVQQSLQFRATGGDHRTMPWQSLEVVTPPRVQTWQLTVHPPAYTNLPAQIWDPKSAIYAESQLELQGDTDQAVAQVELRSRRGRQLAAQVGPQGRSFRVEPTNWCILESDTWTLYLTTAAGLQARSTLELGLEIAVDHPPQVRFIEPTHDLTVVPNIAVPLVIEAIDELAIREIGMNYLRVDLSEAVRQRIPLWLANDMADEASARQQQRVKFLWDLQPLSLAPGSVLEIRGEATDYRPTTGISVAGQTVPALRITVVSEEELWRQIVEQQSRVVRGLADLVRRQRTLATITAEWTNFPAWSIPRRANASHAALLEQQQISAALALGPRSVLGQLTELADSIQRNRLLRDESADRLPLAQERLQMLVDEPLAALERSFGEIARQSQQAFRPEVLRPLLVDSAERQKQVVDALDQVVDLLLPGDVVGQLERELRTIEQDQVRLTEHCRVEVAPQIIQAENAQPEEQAVITASVRRQRELAGRLGALLLRLAQTAEGLARDEPPLAMRMADTVTLAETLGLEATMQEAAVELARHRLGRSASLQQRALDSLAKLQVRLAGQDTAGATERFEQLLLAERKLAILRRQLTALQLELGKVTAAGAQRELERLREQRQTLAEQSEVLTRQLARMQISAAAESIREAASQLRQKKLVGETTQRAQQKLETAQRQLATQRRQQQVALARLQMAQLGRQLSSLIGRQQAVRQKIGGLDILLKKSDQLSNDQQQELRQLARRQADLRREVALRARQLTRLPVFRHLLNRCGETMQLVEAHVQRAELGQPTQVYAAQAVGQLTQLAEAVQQERANLTANQPSASAPQNEAGQAGDTARLQTLQLAVGQLKLLKSLQSTLREKTKSLETHQADGQPQSDLARELASQQQQLTELARQLLSEAGEPLIETPDRSLEQELLLQSLEGLGAPRSDQGNQP